MNKLILLGNLTADPEIKTYPNGSFTTFTIAVSDGWGDKKKTYFVQCVSSGKTGENLAKFFEKGKQILVEGKVYTRKNDKTGYEELRVNVYKFFFVGPKDTAKTTPPVTTAPPANDYDDGDIPF